MLHIIVAGIFFLLGLVILLQELQFSNRYYNTGPALLMFFTFLVCGMVLIIVAWSSQQIGYECNAGLLLFDKRARQIQLVLRWEQIVNAWTEARSYGRGTSTIYCISYWSTNEVPVTIKLPLRDLWVRCTFEIEQHRRATHG